MADLCARAVLRAADLFTHAEFEGALDEFLEVQQDQTIVKLDQRLRKLLAQPLRLEDIEHTYDEVNTLIIEAVDFVKRAELGVQRLSVKLERLEQKAMVFGG